MLSFLAKKEFFPPFITLLGLGIFLFYIDEISENIISAVLGYRFHYFESPFLKLIYLLLLVITISLAIALFRNKNISDREKSKSLIRTLMVTALGGLIGWCIHIYTIQEVLAQERSMRELEENVFVYYSTDFFLLAGYIYGAFRYLRPAIHQN
ncbi:MAG: hypothetical protein R3277_01705 [Brumimicrobium sp.]|nr:hypothetical protein [Brumimicrobium sp.]